MLWFDPQYLLVVGPGVLLSLFASIYCHLTFKRFTEQPLSAGKRGAEVAESVMSAAGVRGVRVERTGGFLTDHYDPTDKVLRLSPEVYDGRSVSAAGVAAHEAGHAIQHASGYLPLRLRQSLVWPARIGSQLSLIVIVIGLFLHALNLAWFGVILFMGILAFELVTLPVEINASRRAYASLVEARIVDPTEAQGVAKVLRAAALTYLAAVVATSLQIVYFILRIRQEEA